MFNVGVGFMAFGLMLWLYANLPLLGAGKRQTTTARIVGYRMFPTDTTITDDNILRGPNFMWHRIVVFTNPQTAQSVEMFSNPGVANPEPIGTSIEISFNPGTTDTDKDSVWIKGGMRAAATIARISFVVGLIVFAVLLAVPRSSPLHLIIILPAFLIVFIAAYINVWKRPNQ